MRVLLIIALLAGAGCASVNTSLNSAFTPGLDVHKDKFDGNTIVRQDEVAAGEGMGDAWHVLGFEWSTKAPRVIYVTAGAQGTNRVNALAFNADGVIVDKITTASEHTEFSHRAGTTPFSSRRFAMSVEDFLKVARAKTVHMRLSQGDNYSVSTFGSDHSRAAVNVKFKPFTDKVLELSKTL